MRLSWINDHEIRFIVFTFSAREHRSIVNYPLMKKVVSSFHSGHTHQTIHTSLFTPPSPLTSTTTTTQLFRANNLQLKQRKLKAKSVTRYGPYDGNKFLTNFVDLSPSRGRSSTCNDHVFHWNECTPSVKIDFGSEMFTTCVIQTNASWKFIIGKVHHSPCYRYHGAHHYRERKKSAKVLK